MRRLVPNANGTLPQGIVSHCHTYMTWVRRHHPGIRHLARRRPCPLRPASHSLQGRHHRLARRPRSHVADRLLRAQQNACITRSPNVTTQCGSCLTSCRCEHLPCAVLPIHEIWLHAREWCHARNVLSVANKCVKLWFMQLSCSKPCAEVCSTATRCPGMFASARTPTPFEIESNSKAALQRARVHGRRRARCAGKVPTRTAWHGCTNWNSLLQGLCNEPGEPKKRLYWFWSILFH